MKLSFSSGLLAVLLLSGCDGSLNVGRMDAEAILAKGGNLKVSAEKFDRTDLESMAAKAVAGNSRLTVTHSGNLDRMDMESIAGKGPGAVTFE
jgi:PBP1b-binding outer membrane lipoprotein LpoB